MKDLILLSPLQPQMVSAAVAVAGLVREVVAFRFIEETRVEGGSSEYDSDADLLRPLVDF